MKRLAKGQQKRGPSKTEKFSEYSRKRQKGIRNKFLTDCESMLSFLEVYDFVATKLEVYNYETNSYEILNLSEGCEIDSELEKKEVLDKKDSDELNMMLYVKKKFGISNQAYYDMSMVCNSMPRSWKIKDRIKQLNEKWDIRPTPGGNGMQQSIRDRLLVRLKYL